MNFCDHPLQPTLPFMMPPFPGGNVGSAWPQLPFNNENSNAHLRFEHEHEPPFKKQWDSEYNPPNFTHFPPINPRMGPPNPPMNKGTSHIFYKTRICTRFMEGTCPNGENCTFAHGFEDLREPPPNWQDLIRERDSRSGDWNNDDNRIIHRMKICKKFYNGEECPYGDKCNFLHESPSRFKNDVEMPREILPINVGTMGPTIEHRSVIDQPELNTLSNAGSLNMVNMKPVYWKTKICSKWEATGQCPFGERCHFAHGQSDLQAPVGRIEAEAMSNISPIKAKPTSVSTIHSSTVSLVDGAHKEEGGSKKNLFKWKIQKKISRIYADWIDDLVPPHIMASKLEK